MRGRRGAGERFHFIEYRYNQGMDEALQIMLKPGSRVRVTQQIAARDYTWTSEVRGTVVEYRQKQTGSWYAHSKDDKLWLDRLTLRKDDGEITTLILDEFSKIELDPTPAGSTPASAVSNRS